jgi:signal transduction histidine kinase
VTGREEDTETFADARLDALMGTQGAAALKEMFDRFPQGVGLLWPIRDEHGAISDFEFGYGNRAILRMFSLPGTMRGRFTFLEALPQARHNGDFDRYARVCETGEPDVDEIAYDTPFGDGYIKATLSRRTARLGDGVAIFVSDVSAQRRTEDELRGYADVVAHDLREPISAMAHLVTLLERRRDRPPEARVLELLRSSTERARALIDGVLAYARAGELHRERVELGALTAEVVDDLRPALEAAGARVEVGDLPAVEGDARQLRRLLQNLIANAVRFRGERAPRVEVGAEPGTAEWMISVRDNGIGVRPDDASRIFAMFARAHAEHDGTGIGLAVCRRVVEALGGRVWVERAQGGGSAFRFTLPR